MDHPLFENLCINQSATTNAIVAEQMPSAYAVRWPVSISAAAPIKSTIAATKTDANNVSALIAPLA